MAQERYRATPAKSDPRRQTQPRRSAAKPPKKTLSPEERRRRERARREALRREREERAYRKALMRERRKRLFRLCFVLSLVLVAVYWVVVAVSIVNRPNGSEEALPLLLFTQGKREEDHKYMPEEVCIGGVKYLPVSFLEKYMAISHFGDQKTRSFLICSTGEYATFYLGTEEAIVNGEHVSIKAPALLKDDVLHLPLDFFADKMNCFQLGLNNNTYGADVLTFDQEIDYRFLFSGCPANAAIPYDPAYKNVPETPEEETKPTT